MKKILFYLPFIKVGGIEKVSIEYLTGLINKGYKVDLIIDFDMAKYGNTFEYAIPKEVNYKYIKSEKVSKFIYYFRTLGKKNKIFNVFLYGFIILFDFYYYHTKVKKILEKEKYDYTISFFQFLPSYITNFKKTKHIIWLHGSVEHFFGGIKNLFKANYEKKLNKYDSIVTIANEMQEQLEEFYPKLEKEKIKMIYNPFNFNEIIKKSNMIDNLTKDEKLLIKDNYICTVTRVDEHQKDLTTLILAYEKQYLNNKIKDKLYIIGDGPSRDNLTELVKDKKLEKQILFLGKKTNPFIWMKKANVFILSSKFEGFGLVLVEAMVVNTFVISSNCKTGPTEILDNEKCGDLFAVGSVNELSDKLQYALNNDKYRDNKIANATQNLERFNFNESINNLTRLLK
ncbi:glycosyltransferase [bacterium]|jgi:glycosyltransferase involved in cell wall biosynthesis|nr:glycosyltransferase [bacterium]